MASIVFAPDDPSPNTKAPICRECGGPILNPRAPNVLLHDDCKASRQLARARKRTAEMSANPLGVTLICPCCKRPFPKIQHAQVYCDTACQYAAKLASEKKRAAAVRAAKAAARKKQEADALRWPVPEAPRLPSEPIKFYKIMAATRKRSA